MSRENTDIKKSKEKHKNKDLNLKTKDNPTEKASGHFLYSMNLAPKIGESSHWAQMLVASFFTAVIIIITRMAVYERPMGQFFWSGGKDQLTDFFSYYKMIAIIICATLVLVFLLYRILTQSFYVKRSFAYIPMIIYSAFVLLSYIFSEYKEFSLLGWNDRFEGTLTLLAYMVMLFFIINSVNSEMNIKWILYSLAGSSALLGILGLSQALDRDFFQTTIGKKLITPSWFWDQLDNLNFIFDEKEIYQTVYNINYVSFYLTLLIPLFGLLFIRSMMTGKEEPIWRKIFWGALFTLLIFNLIGSSSSGGLMGMAIVILIAIVVLNKRIIEWKIPVLILLALTVIVAGISYDRWMHELSSAISGVLGRQSSQVEEDAVPSADMKHTVDYIVTTGNAIIVSFEGNEIRFTTFPDDPNALEVHDASGKSIGLTLTDDAALYRVDDERFKQITVKPAQDKEKNTYILLATDGKEWPFRITPDGPRYVTGVNTLIKLRQIPSVGWENNPGFGNGRGYIWSRTIPMMKETLILGYGADTYCIYFPHDDYVGKYNSGWKMNLIVDKPHNMYMGAIVGTGGISMLALLALWGMYIVQSFFLYRREQYKTFIAFVGAGIFFGICGFLVSGLVNDSSVSVMPMFYGLLGTGISINMMLKRIKSFNNKDQSF